MTLVVGSLLLVLLSQGADDLRPWEKNVAEFFLNLPSWISTGLEWILRLGSLWAVVVLAGGALLARRWRLARDLAIAGAGAWPTARTLALLAAPGRRDELSDVFSAGNLPTFLVISLAVLTAIVATAAPYLVRGLRRTIGFIPVPAAFAALTIPDGLPIDVLGALVLGLVVAGWPWSATRSWRSARRALDHRPTPQRDGERRGDRRTGRHSLDQHGRAAQRPPGRRAGGCTCASAQAARRS